MQKSSWGSRQSLDQTGHSSAGSCAAVTGNTVNLETCFLPFGTISGVKAARRGVARLELLHAVPGTRGAAVGWHEDGEGLLPGSFPMARTLRLLSSRGQVWPTQGTPWGLTKWTVQSSLPYVGLSTAAAKTMFARKLLMNLGFPPTPCGLHLTSVETNLGIPPYSLTKEITPVPLQRVCSDSSSFYQCFSLACSLFPSPAPEWQRVPAALDGLKKEHSTGTRPSRIISDELIISLTCSARLSANTH